MSVLAFALLTLVECVLVLVFSVDFPNADDFTSYLSPLNRCFSENSFFCFDVLLEPHSQHLQVLNRLAALLLTVVTGSLNLKIVMLIGALALPAFIAAVAHSFGPEERSRNFWLAGASLLLLNPLHAEAALWATTALQFLWIYFFSYLSCVYLMKCGQKNFCLAWLFCWISALTQGNGALLFLLGVLSPARKSSERLVLLLSAAITMMLLRSPLAAQPLELSGVPVALVYCLQLIGSGPGFRSPNFSLLLGILIAGYCLTVLHASWKRGIRHPLQPFLIFAALTAVANAFFRSGIDPALAYTTSRYTVLSLLMLSCALALHEIFRPGVAKVALPLCAAFVVFSFLRYLPEYTVRRDLMQNAHDRWFHYRSGLPVQNEAAGRQILSKAEELGIRRIANAAFHSALKPVPFNSSTRFFAQGSAVLEQNIYKNGLLHLQGYLVISEKAPDGTLALLFAGKAGRFALPVDLHVRPEVAFEVNKTRSGQPLASGFYIWADMSALPAGEYELFIVLPGAKGTDWRVPLDVKVAAVASRPED